MCVPSFNEIRESVFELLCTQVKMYGSSTMDMNPVHRLLSSGYINHMIWFLIKPYPLENPPFFAEFSADLSHLKVCAK